MSDKRELKKLKEDLKDLKTKLQKNKESLVGKEQEIIEKNQKIDDYYSQLQRLQADFENYKKRSEKNMGEYIRYANENLILKIIDIYEDLERAIKTDESHDLKNGVEMIYNKLKDILQKEGLQEIESEGEKFDPFKHEALMVENHDDYDEGTIIEQLGKGYTLDSKVIKYCKVKVCKKR